jgi:hypothetical protein
VDYGAENHVEEVSSGVQTPTEFNYDGDGVRVKATVNGTTTVYIDNYFEWTESISSTKKYYHAGATQVAMRTGAAGLNWLLMEDPHPPQPALSQI